MRKTKTRALPGGEKFNGYLQPFAYNTRVRQTDRQTDRRTDCWYRIYAIRIASCGKIDLGLH